MSASQFFRLRQAEPPWGDYGDILAHGMASPTDAGDALVLERTGPFIPPITQPSWGYVVVTATFLEMLEESGLSGYDILPVIKKKVTKIEWRKWEPYGTQEMKYPAGNEPENYILQRKHSAVAAQALSELHYIRFRPGIRITREGGFQLLGATWNGSDCFVADDEHSRYNYVSEGARDWLLNHAAEWVCFEEERRVNWDVR